MQLCVRIHCSFLIIIAMHIGAYLFFLMKQHQMTRQSRTSTGNYMCILVQYCSACMCKVTGAQKKGFVYYVQCMQVLNRIVLHIYIHMHAFIRCMTYWIGVIRAFFIQYTNSLLQHSVIQSYSLNTGS